MITIIQGEDKDITIRLNNESTQDPFDLAGLTEAEVCFDNQDRSQTSVLLSAPTANGSQLSVQDATLGKLTLILGDADTSLFEVTKNETMEITLDFGSDRRKVLIPNAYEVLASKC